MQIATWVQVKSSVYVSGLIGHTNPSKEDSIMELGLVNLNKIAWLTLDSSTNSFFAVLRQIRFSLWH